jgi:Fe-S oxidoreductase
MNPIAMTLLLTCGFGLFAVSIARRWRLLFAGATREPARLTRFRTRWVRVLWEGFLQSRLRYYTWAGWAHSLIFMGFLILLARTLMLWGRGFEPQFELWILGRTPIVNCPVGAFYNALKDGCSALVLAAVAFFFLQRTLRRPKRLTLSREALFILAIIGTLMIADVLYDGAILLLANTSDTVCSGGQPVGCADWARLAAGVGWPMYPIEWRAFPDPLGSLAALGMLHIEPRTLASLARFGFWTHSVLVIVFLNLLPYSKHFHILTALPNLFLSSTSPKGKLETVAESAEALLQMADLSESTGTRSAAPLGISRIDDLSWKDRLDLYSCTECGRCSEHCPAFRTGKPLSPKQLTLDLRNALFKDEARLFRLEQAAARTGDQPSQAQPPGSPLIPFVINPETVWSCTTCRACEEQCPVGISYLDKIVGMRRDLVLMRGEVPSELQRCFEGMERAGNPWNLSRKDRSIWAAGLGVPSLAECSEVEVLYWVGCAASYDARAQRVAKAFVSLLQRANVSFAILGNEETCTGDSARRAGNEYLFMQLASANVATLNRYFEDRKFQRIVTACPHCLTTLKNEYPDLGGKWPVSHHSEYILELVQRGRLQPAESLTPSFVFHDPCTLARYAGDVVSSRRLLQKVPGAALREAVHNRQFTMCCGAGGARMWMDEGLPPRMNVERSKELLATGAEQIVTACPFCNTMIGEAVAQETSAQKAEVWDIAEVFAKSCLGQSTVGGPQTQAQASGLPAR